MLNRFGPDTNCQSLLEHEEIFAESRDPRLLIMSRIFPHGLAARFKRIVWRDFMNRLLVACALVFALFVCADAHAEDTGKRSSFFDGLLDQAKKFVQPSRRATREESTQLWDAFLTGVAKRAAGESADSELRGGFFSALVDGRFDVIAMLSSIGGATADPLRQLFLSSWPRLAPLFEQLANSLPGDAATRYRSLLDAGNALRDVGKIGGQISSELSSLGLTPDTLRKLAGLVGVKDPLLYDTAVDPELREVFGFGAPLAVAGDPPHVAHDPLDWLVPAVHAGEPNVGGDIASLAKRLNGWVPKRNDVAEYLPLMRSLLHQTAEQALTAKPLEPEFRALYDDLVLATAWQESCWRQFVRNKKGAVTPIQSGVGSVGLMQINQKVWRGFYDLGGLNRDVAYNGAAGAEILRHYLRDYAIKRGEHTATGQADNLARATYAMYNGGPGHIRRYREARERADLKAIDAAFWVKYQAVKAGDELGVERCYTASGSVR